MRIDYSIFHKPQGELQNTTWTPWTSCSSPWPLFGSEQPKSRHYLYLQITFKPLQLLCYGYSLITLNPTNNWEKRLLWMSLHFQNLILPEKHNPACFSDAVTPQSLPAEFRSVSEKDGGTDGDRSFICFNLATKIRKTQKLCFRVADLQTLRQWDGF